MILTRNTPTSPFPLCSRSTHRRRCRTCLVPSILTPHNRLHNALRRVPIVFLSILHHVVEIMESLKHFYEHFLEHPVSWFFNHVIVKSEYGKTSENLYPITFLMSIFWLALTTFLMSAVCQRWVALIKQMGYISFSRN